MSNVTDKDDLTGCDVGLGLIHPDTSFLIRALQPVSPEDSAASYVHELADGFAAQRVIDDWIEFYNGSRILKHGRNHDQVDLLAGCRVGAHAGRAGTPLGRVEVRSVAASNSRCGGGRDVGDNATLDASTDCRLPCASARWTSSGGSTNMPPSVMRPRDVGRGLDPSGHDTSFLLDDRVTFGQGRISGASRTGLSYALSTAVRRGRGGP